MTPYNINSKILLELKLNCTQTNSEEEKNCNYFHKIIYWQHGLISIETKLR